MAEKSRLPSVDTLLRLSTASSSIAPTPLSSKSQSHSFSSLSLPYHPNNHHHHHPNHHHYHHVPPHSNSSMFDHSALPSSSSALETHDGPKHLTNTSIIDMQTQSFPRLPSVEEVLKGKHLHQQQLQRRSSTTGTLTTGVKSTSRNGYPCERCGKLFTRKSDAIKHIRVVHDRLMPFSCAVCGRKFARKDYCMKHEKSIHNIAPPTSPHQTRKKVTITKAGT